MFHRTHTHTDYSMTPLEIRATGCLSAVFSLRMLGMFMVLPVLTTYGMALKDANETLIGIAIGIYGLMQALFQIPFGLWSDRFGRKPLMITGLLIFVAGSIIATLSPSIWNIILGRALQGAGAISSVTIALLSDLTREQNRTKAMAVIGSSIGVTFAAAMICSPVITHFIGLGGLFWVIAVLGSLSILLTVFAVPECAEHTVNRESSFTNGGWLTVLAHPQLIKLDTSIFLMHFLLMSTFIALPVELEHAGFAAAMHWKIYLGVMLAAYVFVLPGIIVAEVKRKMRVVLLACIVLLLLSEAVLWLSGSRTHPILLGMLLFFTAFNLIEALLPSLISKEAPAGYRGTAMGAYSTSQFLGVACGGSIGGWIAAHYGIQTIFLIGLLVAVFWLLLTCTFKEPRYLANLRFTLPEGVTQETPLQDFFLSQNGVEDAVVIAHERSAYIKIDSQRTNRQTLQNALDEWLRQH